VAIPSQALRPNGRREGVETRRAAPKARTRYGEGIVQTTNSSRRERVDEAAQAVAGTKIRWGKPRAGSIPAARTIESLFVLISSPERHVKKPQDKSGKMDIATVGEKVATVDVTIGPRFLNLFSEHLYSSPNKAFEELVSNSWDAGAETVYISAPDDLTATDASIWILDDGQSMDINGLQLLWSVATSKKRESETINGRKQIGKFGVGKLATYILANQLTHICKAPDGKIRAVTMDYRLIDEAAAAATLHIEKLPLSVRELTQAKLESLLKLYPNGQAAFDLINKNVPALKKAPDYENEFGAPEEPSTSPKGTWTLAVLSSLKESGQKLQQGWIKRILRSALPLSGTISVKFNDEILYSSKSAAEVEQDWTLGPSIDIDSLTLPDDTTVTVTAKDKPYPHLEIPGLGVVSGRARLYKSRISGGKSDEVDYSNGFFVNVLGRVIKPDDPYFGLENLSHSSWSKFRATVRADALDERLAVTRESISESAELHIMRALLMRLFNKARSAHDAAAQAGWPNAGEILIEKWGVVPFEPLQRVVADRLGNSLPPFVDVSNVADIEEVRKQWAQETSGQPDKLITNVVVEEGPSTERLVKYDVAKRQVVVNLNHPFTREHGTTQEQLRLLRDTALVELLTDAFMTDIGLPDDQLREILNYRERAYRLVAQVRRHSASQIVTMLLESTNHPKGFERIVGDALENLGFGVERLGQSGEPEGIATALITPVAPTKADDGDQKVAYRFTYDAKSSASGKVATHNIGMSGLARHRKQHGADHTLVVAPGYADGALQKEATDNAVTPIKAADLATLVMLAAGYGPLNLAQFRKIFELHDPSKVADWVKNLESNMQKSTSLSLDTLIQALDEITKSNPDRPDMLDCTLIADRCRKVLNHNTFPTRGQVAQTIRGLSLIIPNVIQIAPTGYDVMLSAPPAKIKDALTLQLNNVPTNLKFGITHGVG
jgi:Histidine kinase-, DNA gyrase B-, and HSP90-like ATPase